MIIEYPNKDHDDTKHDCYVLAGSVVLALSRDLLFKCNGIKENNTENGNILSNSLVMSSSAKPIKFSNFKSPIYKMCLLNR